MSAKDWSDWRWAFFFMALRIGYCYVWVEQNAWIPFFRLHEASEVLDKYVMGVWSDDFTAAFFVSVIVTGFVRDIEGIEYKLMFMNWNDFSVNVTSTCRANLYDISRRHLPEGPN